eukprot:6766815-Alexandrium_andersonii.AAC.1
MDDPEVSLEEIMELEDGELDKLDPTEIEQSSEGDAELGNRRDADHDSADASDDVAGQSPALPRPGPPRSRSAPAPAPKAKALAARGQQQQGLGPAPSARAKGRAAGKAKAKSHGRAVVAGAVE